MTACLVDLLRAFRRLFLVKQEGSCAVGPLHSAVRGRSSNQWADFAAACFAALSKKTFPSVA